MSHVPHTDANLLTIVTAAKGAVEGTSSLTAGGSILVRDNFGHVRARVDKLNESWLLDSWQLTFFEV